MYLCGLAVLELEKPYLPKGNRPHTLCLSKDLYHRSYILAILHSRQPTVWLHDLCQEVQTGHGNELLLFGAKAFPIFISMELWIRHCKAENQAATPSNELITFPCRTRVYLYVNILRSCKSKKYKIISRQIPFEQENISIELFMYNLHFTFNKNY